MRPRSRSGPGTSRVYLRQIDRSVASPPPDLAFGAFSERAPWLVELDKLPWRRGVDTERARSRASVADVGKVVESDLGAPLETLFSKFADEPLAAASSARVHGACLRTGEEVVVKVQRPRVAALVAADIAAMAWLAPKLVGRIPIAAPANPPALVDLFPAPRLAEPAFP